MSSDDQILTLPGGGFEVLRAITSARYLTCDAWVPVHRVYLTMQGDRSRFVSFDRASEGKLFEEKVTRLVAGLRPAVHWYDL